MKPNHPNQSLEPGKFYHIYNRGINGETLFKEERNYYYFLRKYDEYLTCAVETYAYCLLGNHFHLLVRVREEETLRSLFNQKNGIGLHSFGAIVSKQFAKLFSSYTQSINKSFGRTGGLFESPFRRILIDNDVYLTRLIHYIHLNPVHHGFCENYQDYLYSSYHSHLSKRNTKLAREEVISWFGSTGEYKESHASNFVLKGISKLIIEDF